MGFFSFNTSDTNKSISNKYSRFGTFTVHMIVPDGRVWTEENYEGYGVFGGKDIYELIAELNDFSGRDQAIDEVFKDNPSGEFYIAAKRGLILPKLVENSNLNYVHVPCPSRCLYQGYFYNEEDEDDGDDCFCEE